MVMLLLVDESRRSKSEKQKTKSKPPPFAPKVHGRSGWGTRNGHDQKTDFGAKKIARDEPTESLPSGDFVLGLIPPAPLTGDSGAPSILQRAYAVRDRG